jgi:hypothetical protein
MGGCRAGGPGKSDCGRAGWATGSRRREPSPFGARLRRIEVALISDYSGAQNELAFPATYSRSIPVHRKIMQPVRQTYRQRWVMR